LDSYLYQLLQELEQLQQGVPAFDAITGKPFLLKAHLVLVTGDTPAVTKFFHLTGHMGKHPCRACNIEGIPHRTMSVAKKGKQPRAHTQHYYPLGPDVMVPIRSRTKGSRLPRSNIFIENLRHRTHEEYIRDGLAAQRDHSSHASLHSSVKRVSLLALLLTISFPESCLFDLIHLIYCDFSRDLCALLNSTYFSKDAQQSLNDHNGRMSEKD
jgi:hypothetical protein